MIDTDSAEDAASTPSDQRYRIGIDIGGTFTDFVLVDARSGEIAVEKTLTTPRHPEEGVLAGLARLGERFPGLLPATRDVIHATTLVTNVILERKGAKTALLTTAGFSDILEIAREVRYTVFDMFIRYPEPLVPRRLRFDIGERMLADGSVFAPLSEEDVREAASVIRREGVEAVAICFLHAYRNPAHEIRVAEILAEELPDVALSLSHEVHPEPKEFERTSTTVMNAYVKRVVDSYTDKLVARLAEGGFRNRLYLMLSNGGTATSETARQFPVQMLESGPAAGVEAASFYGKLLGLDQILAFDMGGTTAKLCVVEDGRATRTKTFEVGRVHRFTVGSGIPVALPVYDLLEIGAGGGSIARVDGLGLLSVGPRSAGSDPGPICYGRGGTEPTVTDADLALGYLNADYFLGGEMRLDREAAVSGIAERLAKPLGISTVAAAAGVHKLVNETMASAARMHLTEKGKDPGAMTLVASGGAGPGHAVELARKLGCPHLVVPPYSGVMSALGLLAAPVAFERTRAVRRLLDDIDDGELETAFRELEESATALLPEGSERATRRVLEMRYSGQDYALEIEVAPDKASAGLREGARKDYLAVYERLYGKIDYDSPIEIAAINVRVSRPETPPEIRAPQVARPARPKANREVYVMSEEAMREVPVFERAMLAVGQRIEGPAVVEERESTAILGPGDALEVDPRGCLIIRVAPLGRNAPASELPVPEGARP